MSIFLPKIKNTAIINKDILRFIITSVSMTPVIKVRLGDFQEIIYSA
jgi:hypothetical protein